MKKIIYDSWIARNLLFKGYTTITLTAFVRTRYKSEAEMPHTQSRMHARAAVV